MLSEDQFLDVMRNALWVSVVTSTPILVVALLVGIVIGLFQALTSIQEMTLTFVPKLAAIIVIFWISMDFMTQTLTHFFRSQIIPLIIGV